jgi:diguanylate cyclase (GGDEF)-like protein/PAS domain S-box-containing protein
MVWVYSVGRSGRQNGNPGLKFCTRSTNLAVGSTITSRRGLLSGQPNELLVFPSYMSKQRNFQNDEILAAIVRDSDDAILSKTLDAVITSWNPGAERMYGYTADEVIGQPVSILVPTNLADELASIMARIRMGERVHHYETLRRHKDGHLIHVSLTVSPIRNKHGEIVGASSIARDITARLQAEREREERMSHLAYHDALTGLPNRLLFNDLLAKLLSASHRHQDKLAIVFVDIDSFKSVNDRLGHAVGDALLKAVANSLAAGLRGNDTVSRHGGDEFVILLTEIKDTSHAAMAVQRIAASLETVHRIGPHDVLVTASIGISIYPDHGETGEVLLNKADAAMYRAKNDEGTKYQFAA